MPYMIVHWMLVSYLSATYYVIGMLMKLMIHSHMIRNTMILRNHFWILATCNSDNSTYSSWFTNWLLLLHMHYINTDNYTLLTTLVPMYISLATHTGRMLIVTTSCTFNHATNTFSCIHLCTF